MRSRSISGTAGRCGPLRARIFSSLSRPTIRKSPKRRAASRYMEWPSCRMSKEPLVRTTLRPSVRSAPTMAWIRVVVRHVAQVEVRRVREEPAVDQGKRPARDGRAGPVTPNRGGLLVRWHTLFHGPIIAARRRRAGVRVQARRGRGRAPRCPPACVWCTSAVLTRPPGTARTCSRSNPSGAGAPPVVLDHLAAQFAEPACQGFGLAGRPRAPGQRVEPPFAAFAESERKYGPQFRVAHEKGGKEMSHASLGENSFCPQMNGSHIRIGLVTGICLSNPNSPSRERL